MQIFILIAFGTFFVLSVLFLSFYIKERNRRDKLASGVKKLESDLSILNKKYEIAVQELKKPTKKGYFKGSINLIIDKEKNIGQLYEYVVHVNEVERYTNGECKIKLDYIDVVSGFDPGQYSWIKESASRRFPSIMKISDIEWLESEDSIKELRKEKLEKLNSLNVPTPPVNQNYSSMTIDELKDLLQLAIQHEEYEKAAQIRNELNKKK